MTKLSIIYNKIKEVCKEKDIIPKYKWNQKGVNYNTLKEYYDELVNNKYEPAEIGGNNDEKIVNITLDLEEIFQYKNIPITEGTVGDIKNEVVKFVNKINLPPGELMVQVGLHDKSNEDKSAISTRFTEGKDLNELVTELFNTVDRVLEEYDKDWASENNIVANEFFIKYIEVTYIKKCRISESIANDRWIIIDSNTDKNCLFVATEVCRKWKNNIKFITDNKYRIEIGKTLKKRSNKHLITKDTLYLFCLEHEINIIAYNNIYEKIDYKGQELLNFPKVEMQFVNNWSHAKPMLRRKEVEKYYNINTEKIIKENKVGNKRYVQSYFKDAERDTRFGTWDIETFGNNCIPYGIGVYIKEIIQFYGSNCVEEFIEYLTNINTNITLYAHNGGKFDIKCILNNLLNSKYFMIKKNPIYQDNSITMLEIINVRTNVKITFKDSYRLFSSSLKNICIGFNVQQKGEFDHNKVVGYIQDPELLEESKEYNKIDCISLFECLDIFSKLIFNKFSINITKTLSASTLAKQIFASSFNNKQICILNKDEDFYIRKGYYGGRTECFKLGIFKGKYNYYDYTSLYPYVGTLNLLPIGIPEYISGITIEEIINDNTNVYFVNCIVQSTKDILPVLGIKYNNKYVFPKFINPTKLYAVYSPELKLAYIKGYNIQVLDCIKFKRGRPLKEYYTQIYEYKKNAKDPAIKYMWKIILNSGYGFFGLRINGKQSLKISCKGLQEYKKYLLDGKLINHKRENKYSLMLIEDDIHSNISNVGIASAITSLARCMMYSTMEKIQNLGGVLYYCDTDSIITDIYLEDKMKINNELGYLKNELDSTCPDSIFITDLMISGPKSYWFKTNTLYEHAKLKGCSSNDKKEIIAYMINKYFGDRRADEFVGSRINNSNQQISISSSISMLLRDGTKCNPVITNITKSYKINYTKGIVNGTDITPLLL